MVSHSKTRRKALRRVTKGRTSMLQPKCLLDGWIVSETAAFQCSTYAFRCDSMTCFTDMFCLSILLLLLITANMGIDWVLFCGRSKVLTIIIQMGIPGRTAQWWKYLSEEWKKWMVGFGKLLKVVRLQHQKDLWRGFQKPFKHQLILCLTRTGRCVRAPWLLYRACLKITMSTVWSWLGEKKFKTEY